MESLTIFLKERRNIASPINLTKEKKFHKKLTTFLTHRARATISAINFQNRSERASNIKECRVVMNNAGACLRRIVVTKLQTFFFFQKKTTKSI